MVCCFETDSRLYAIHQPFEIVSSLNSSGYLFEKLVSRSNGLSYMCKNIVILSKVWGCMYLFEKKNCYPFKRLELSFPKNTWFLSQKNFVASHLRCQSVF